MDSDSSPSIEVAVGNGAWRTAVTDLETLVRTAATAALRTTPIPLGPACEVGIRLADDAELRALNRDFRGQDRPTNVLSFPGDLPDSARAHGQPLLLGDLALALETTVREADELGRTVEAHLAHLVVHGILHLLGHDHEDDRAAEAMEALETGLLAELGYADPYAVPDPARAPGGRAAEPALAGGRP